MSSGRQDPGSEQLFREIEEVFESLSRLIDRAIDHLTANGMPCADIERLHRAKEAARRGALRSGSSSWGAAMLGYCLFFFDSAARTKMAHEFEAENDESAIKISEAWRNGRKIELWQHDRRVKRWE